MPNNEDESLQMFDRDIIQNRVWIEEQLAALDFVEFDRFMMSQWGEHQGVTVYGWIDREDAYKDFLAIIFWPANEDFYYVTSSDDWTDEIQRRLGGEPDDHNPCNRVEHAFDIENAIELNRTADREAIEWGESRLAPDHCHSDEAHDPVNLEGEVVCGACGAPAENSVNATNYPEADDELKEVLE